jgi:hypothetical protein
MDDPRFYQSTLSGSRVTIAADSLNQARKRFADIARAFSLKRQAKIKLVPRPEPIDKPRRGNPNFYKGRPRKGKTNA